MTDTNALVAAQPWTRTEARAGLIDRAVGKRGVIGTTPVRVLLEPLMKIMDDGSTAQSVRVLFSAVEAAHAAKGLRIEANGDDLILGQAPSPAGSLRLLVTAVDEARDVELVIPSLGDERLPFSLTPQREWTVHVVHHSHFDFGYTDPQGRVFAQQRSYLDSAVDLVNQTADWPKESRFRWAVESLWAFSDWAKLRPRHEVDEFIHHVKDGSLELTALPYNLHTDTCSPDELHELLREARRIRDEYGVEFTTAMQTDVPGQVVGLPDALHDAGVRYLAVAHNWAGRSMPHTNGGENMPRLFRWKTPAGGSVLVWMTDSPHGGAYMEGPMVGFSETFQDVEELLPAYLTALATKGYPFPPGVFGAHGEDVEGRDPYPWDILHLRTHAYRGDNGAARLKTAQIVREWNETWASPKLRTSRNEDFFVDAEARLKDEIQTFEGDWGDWWVEGVGSAAVPMLMNREAQAGVTEGQSLSRMSQWLGGHGVPDEHRHASEIYSAISMFNEHTWGASNPWNLSDEGGDSGETQWQWKVAHAITAQQRSGEFIEHALVYLGAAIPAAPDALASFVVANTFARPRTSSVRLFIKESHVPFGTAFEIRDGRTGEAVPYRVEEQSNTTHREIGLYVTFQVLEAPSFGYVRFDVVATGDARIEHTELTAESNSRAELLTIENEFLRVVVDETHSCISSIVELATGRELVNQNPVAGFNAYIYDTYGSAGGYNHLANKLSVSSNLELLVGRTLARPSIILERVNDGVEQRLVYEYTADGIDWARVTLRLRRGEPRLLIENRLSKPKTITKESAFFAFPFAAENPTLRYEVSGGVTGDGLPHVPGAPQHMRAIRNWVSIEGEGGMAVAWATKDAPLVHPHSIALPYAPFPASTSPQEPATVFSWVHNNVWDTNFPIEQGFVATFAYSVGVRTSDAGPSVEGLAIQTAVNLTNPLRAVHATGAGTAQSATASLLDIGDDRVRVASVSQPDDAAENTVIVRLQSFSQEGITATMKLSIPIENAELVTYLNDTPRMLSHEGGVVQVPFEPFAVIAVRLTTA